MNPNMDVPPYFGMPMSLNTSGKYPSQPMNPNKKQNQYSAPRYATNQTKKPQKPYQDFYKTQMCPMLAMGNCYKNEKCTYAHSEQELRKRPDFVKTKLCDNFMKTGSCINEDKCMFAHGYSELKYTPEFYKTALCFNWKNTGTCQIGDKCRYAHGEHELKPPLNTNQYDTKKYEKMDNMGNSMDAYFPGAYSMGNNMQPSQQNYMDNYAMPRNDSQNYFYMGNEMQELQGPPGGYKQMNSIPNMNFNPYDPSQMQMQGYQDFSGFSNRK